MSAITQPLLKGITAQEVVDFYYADTPLRRLQTPEDIAATVVFLASAAASSITGESVAVNGGSYMD